MLLSKKNYSILSWYTLTQAKPQCTPPWPNSSVAFQGQLVIHLTELVTWVRQG